MPRFGFRVYVACSLTHATSVFRQEIEVFKKHLALLCHVLSFLGWESGAKSSTIYSYDIEECVYKSDLVVAICDLPSIGLGMEIGTQVEARKKPCLFIAREGVLVTDMVLDVPRPGAEFRRYRDLLTDGVELVADKLKKMQEEETLRYPLFRLIQPPQSGKVVLASA
jgi:hypothetical protein